VPGRGQLPAVRYNAPLPQPCPGAWIKTRRPLHPKDTPGSYIVGPVFEGVSFHTAVSDGFEQRASIATRVTAPHGEPQQPAWDVAMRVAQRLIPPAVVPPESFDSWLSHFSAAKRIPFMAAYNRIARGEVPLKEYTKLKCFVKREVKLWVYLGCEVEEVKPRNIISICDVVKVLLGPYFRAFMRHLHERVFPATSPLFMECGATAEQVGTWFTSGLSQPFGSGSLMEIDYSKFDMTNGAAAMAVKIAVARRLGLSGFALKIYSLLDAPSIRMTTRAGVSAGREPMVLSGHPDTTFGNSVLNLVAIYTAIVLSYARQHNMRLVTDKDWHDAWPVLPQPGVDFRVMVRGDDMLGNLRAPLRTGVLDVLTELGYKPKAKFGHPLEDARFCSNAFYPSNMGWRPAPTFKCLLKMGVTISDVPVKQRNAHRRGVALGLLAQTRHVPILSEYIQAQLRATRGAHGKYLKEAVREARIKYLPCPEVLAQTAESCVHVAKMYRVPLWVITDVAASAANMTEVALYNSTAIEILVHAVGDVEG